MKRREIRSVLALAFVAILLELLLFNVRSFELIGRREVNIPLTLIRSTAPLPNGATQTIYKTSPGQKFPADVRNLSLQLPSVPAPIRGSIHLEQEGLLAGSSRPLEIIPGVEHSAVPALFPSKPVIGITITFESAEETLSAVLNSPLPVRINEFRLFLIFLFLGMLWLIRPNSATYQQPFNLQLRWQKGVILMLLLVQIAFLTFSMVSTTPDFFETVKKGNLREEDYIFKQHYQLLTESLFQKKTALLDAPPERLAQAENPYDSSQRINQFPSYIWDTSYYDGKYYVYFGVVPAIVFYIPYTLIFKRYPLNDVAVLFFAVLGSVGLCALYLRLIRRWFKNLPAPLVWMGLAALFNTIFLGWFIRRSFSYELALVSAFGFTVCGLALNLHAAEQPKRRNIRLFFGCLLMALAVGCRPTALVASLLNLPILLPLLFTKNNKKRMPSVQWRSFTACAVPYLLIGTALMAYNYIRFGSLLEFGRTWQLSIQESSVYVNGNPVAAFLIGSVNYLPGSGVRLTSDFPFLQPNPPLTFSFWGIKEYYPIFATAAIFPLIWILLFPSIYWRSIRCRGKSSTSLFFLLVLLPILLAGITGQVVGTIQRYSLDFTWMFALAALLAAFSAFGMLQNHRSEKAFFFVFTLCFLISLFAQLPLSGGESYFGKSWFELMNPLLFKQISYLFSFWL